MGTGHPHTTDAKIPGRQPAKQCSQNSTLSILRKIWSLGLMMALLLPSALYWQYNLHLQHHQHEMEEKMELAMLTTLHIPVAKLHWEKPGKELKIGETLFDVKQLEIKEGIAVVKGLYDDQEKELHRWAEQQTGKHQKQGSIPHFPVWISQTIKSELDKPGFAMVNSEFRVFHSGFYKHKYSGIQIPPPKQG
jgi:hypothetical protein